MYVLTVRDHFDAAHSLRGYDGECQRLHGHTWDVEVSVEGTELDGIGILYDFKTLKADLRSALDDYDHRYLDEVAPFDTMNATAENLARIVYERLETVVGAGVRVSEVAVWESPIARLVYRPGPA
jgi:6-pyruvoyltetrahydropterin/6-carboxytetrahydropterin synthase